MNSKSKILHNNNSNNIQISMLLQKMIMSKRQEIKILYKQMTSNPQMQILNNNCKMK